MSDLALRNERYSLRIKEIFREPRARRKLARLVREFDRWERRAYTALKAIDAEIAAEEARRHRSRSKGASHV